MKDTLRKDILFSLNDCDMSKLVIIVMQIIWEV